MGYAWGNIGVVSTFSMKRMLKKALKRMAWDLPALYAD